MSTRRLRRLAGGACALVALGVGGLVAAGPWVSAPAPGILVTAQAQTQDDSPCHPLTTPCPKPGPTGTDFPTDTATAPPTVQFSIPPPSTTPTLPPTGAPSPSTTPTPASTPAPSPSDDTGGAAATATPAASPSGTSASSSDTATPSSDSGGGFTIVLVAMLVLLGLGGGAGYLFWRLR